MRLAISWLLLALPVLASTVEPGTFAVSPGRSPGWRRIFPSVNLREVTAEQAQVVVGGPAPGPNKIFVLEGDSAEARALGVTPTNRTVVVRNVLEERAPQVEIIWKDPMTVAVFRLPMAAKIYARERWGGAPLLAGWKTETGSVLWLAAPPGAQGFERYPYLLHALRELGMSVPYQSRNLWAFFDWSYRVRVDLDYFAARWRQAGIAGLHVAAWHFTESDVERDAYLRRLIEACHRHGILVYAWIELPHVSEQFWNDHPEWREKTALGQDAHLDWRKLMNLTNPKCAEAAELAVSGMLTRFDWDGANLAELYFESLEGYANAARFTPLNQEVRAEFRAQKGFDPMELFDPRSASYHGKSPKPMRAFLDYRAELAQRLQKDWVARLEKVQKTKPHLDLILTHVDDRLDSTMRDTIAADSGSTLSWVQQKGITFLAEDPATVWDRGPQRYTELAQRYKPVAQRPELLAIDINIVERYQDVYPTRQQTGAELLQLVNLASRAFPRVALYFENSIHRADWPLLASAAAVVTKSEVREGVWKVENTRGVGVAWRGNARVNGQSWPVSDGEVVWLPKGASTIEADAAPANPRPRLRITDLNGDLLGAGENAGGIWFEYESKSRALAILSETAAVVRVDGAAIPAGKVLELAPGRHRVECSR